LIFGVRLFAFAVLSAVRGLGGGTPKERSKTMAKTYRDVAIDQMIATVEEAMSRAIDWWGEPATTDE
jgi:hypothetical protein